MFANIWTMSTIKTIKSVEEDTLKSQHTYKSWLKIPLFVLKWHKIHPLRVWVPVPVCYRYRVKQPQFLYQNQILICTKPFLFISKWAITHLCWAGESYFIDVWMTGNRRPSCWSISRNNIYNSWRKPSLKNRLDIL